MAWALHYLSDFWPYRTHVEPLRTSNDGFVENDRILTEEIIDRNAKSNSRNNGGVQIFGHLLAADPDRPLTTTDLGQQVNTKSMS
jgi:hypothetical protein